MTARPGAGAPVYVASPDRPVYMLAVWRACAGRFVPVTIALDLESALAARSALDAEAAKLARIVSFDGSLSGARAAVAALAPPPDFSADPLAAHWHKAAGHA